jgi:restriction system protein
MSIVTILVGALVLAICFGLMVWGQKYLGEESGREHVRKKEKEEGQNSAPEFESPCRKCGACGEKKEEEEVGRVNWIDQISHFTADEFERHVKEIVDASGITLTDFESMRLEKLHGVDGEYEIDIVARFSAFNTNFRVLIECKAHKNPIKRDLVQILNDKLRSTGSQKGMLFSTSPFQKGAINFAKINIIALIQMTDKEPVVFNYAGSPPPEIPSKKVAAYLVSLADGERITHTRLGLYDDDILFEAFGLIPKNDNIKTTKIRITF